MRQCCPVLIAEAVNPQPVLQMLKWYFIKRAFLALLAAETRCDAQTLDTLPFSHSCEIKLVLAKNNATEANISVWLYWVNESKSSNITATLQMQWFPFSVRVTIREGIICENVTHRGSEKLLRSHSHCTLQTSSSALCYRFSNIYYTSPSLSFCPPPWLASCLSQHQASPSYSQLNVYRGFNQGFAQATAFYMASSSVFPEVSCIRSLSLSSAQSNHPYWYLVGSSVSRSLQVRPGSGLAAAIS